MHNQESVLRDQRDSDARNHHHKNHRQREPYIHSDTLVPLRSIRDDRVRHIVRRTLGEGIRMSLRNQVLHYADLDYDADEISRLLHVDRRLVLQIEAHRNDPEPATPTEGEQPTLI